MSNTNRDLSKWLCYAGAFFFCFFLERCIFNAIPLWHAVPLLAPLAVAAAGFLEGAFSGAVFGLGAGFLCALTYGQGNARMIWCLTLVGMLCGATVKKALGRTFPGYLLCAVGAMGFLEGMQLLLRLLFAEGNAGAVVGTALGEAGYSLLFTPMIFWVFWLVYRHFRSPLEF